MIRTFVKNSSMYFTSNAISKVISLAFFGYIARLFSVHQMGQYALLQIVLRLLTLFMTLAISSGFTRYYLEFSTDAEKDVFEYSTVNLLFVANVVMGFVLFLLRPVVETLMIPIAFTLFLVLLSLPFVTAVGNIYCAKLRLQNRALAASLVPVLQLLVYVGSTLLFLGLGLDNLLALFLGMLAQHAFVTVCYGFNMNTWRARVSFSSIRRSVKFSAMLVPSALGAYLSLLTGKYLLGKMMDIESVGIYQATNKVALITLMIMQPIYHATVPIVYKEYRNSAFVPRYRILLGIHLVLLLGLVVLFSLFGREFVWMIAGTKYVASSHLVYPFVLVAVLAHIAHFSAINIHLAQKTQYDTVIELVSGLLNVGLTVWLIGQWGFFGAIVALVITYSIRYLMYLFLGHWLFPQLPIRRGVMIGYVLACCALLSGHYLLRNLSVPLRILICLVEGAAVVIVFAKWHNIRWQQIFSLLKREAQPPGPFIEP